MFQSSVKNLLGNSKVPTAVKADNRPGPRCVRETSAEESSDFNFQTAAICSAISELRKFLLDNRRRYLGLDEVLGQNKTMTDEERDAMDVETGTALYHCQEAIAKLKLMFGTVNGHVKETGEHREAVIASLATYASEVEAAHAGMCDLRLRRAVFRLKLESPGSVKGTRRCRSRRPLQRICRESEGSSTLTAHSKPAQKKLSEELDVFQRESKQMLIELETKADLVQTAQTRVAEVSRLQAEVTKNIAEQQLKIQTIAGDISEAKEDIEEGNKLVKKAMKETNDLRWGVVFFILICSLALLYLEWVGSR